MIPSMKGFLSIFARKRPKISVNLPIYNTIPEHLRKCIESILGQTFGDFELLILNDSPDNKELDAIVKSYKDPRIIYRKNKKNMGISGARNVLLDMSRGEYIAVHDHDDASYPERFEKQVAFLDDNPNYGAVSCNYTLTEDGGHYFTYSNQDNIGIKKNFTTDPSFLHPGSMLRKSVLDEHKIRYEAAYSPAEDNRLFMRMADVTLMKIMPEHLFFYRWHDDNTSVLQQSRMTAVRQEIAFQCQNKYPAVAIEQVLSELQSKIDELSQKIDRLGKHETQGDSAVGA
jgi:glycosyltransferase involved in cell wall biosynthesis